MKYNNYDLNKKSIIEEEMLNKVKESNYYMNNKKENFNYNNQNRPVEFYEVLTDAIFFWIHEDDLVKICKELTTEQLISFKLKLDKSVVSGKKYIMVEESFLDFIKNNTFNPKYCPRFSLLKTRKSNFYIDEEDKTAEKISQSIRIDGTIVPEYEPTKSR